MLLALNGVAPAIPAIIRTKDGTVYQLQTPPHLSNGRFVFTASDGRVYSLAEAEVDEVRLLTPASDSPVAPDRHDSHQLGAIARQERGQKGKYTLISPAPTPRPKKGERP
jgi:hypothetical protein